MVTPPTLGAMLEIMTSYGMVKVVGARFGYHDPQSATCWAKVPLLVCWSPDLALSRTTLRFSTRYSFKWVVFLIRVFRWPETYILRLFCITLIVMWVCRKIGYPATTHGFPRYCRANMNRIHHDKFPMFRQTHRPVDCCGLLGAASLLSLTSGNLY